MWTHEFWGLDYELEPNFGPILPKTAFEKIEEGSGNAQAVEERPCPSPPAFWRLLNSRVAAERPYLPIHRAMVRMLHADERYANRVFMPNGQFTAD
jgi:hypothetical protein